MRRPPWVLVLVLLLPGSAAVAQSSRTEVVQPGSPLVSPLTDSSCTAGYLASDRAGAVYVLLGSDCAPYGSEGGSGAYTVYFGSRSWRPGTGPGMDARTRSYGHRPLGRFVAQHKPYSDPFAYSVLRLDRGQRWSAAVPLYGPTEATAWRSSTSGPTQLSYVCSDSSAVDVGFGTGEATYRDGGRDVIAPAGATPRTVRLADPVNGVCEGAPAVMSTGDGAPKALGLLAKSVDGQVVRLDAVLDDVAKRFGLALTLLSSGSGRTIR